MAEFIHLLLFGMNKMQCCHTSHVLYSILIIFELTLTRAKYLLWFFLAKACHI